ncbi:WD40-repeat-containing domain protein [Phlyctochytrium arcticum]|nr:WD40-repeat-containing domain protein [Phlyctochytrium arcticum]
MDGIPKSTGTRTAMALVPGQHNHYCYRHRPGFQKEKEDQKRSEIGQRLAGLSHEDQSTVSEIWKVYASSRSSLRPLILDGLLHHSCLPQLSYLSSALAPLVRIDFVTTAPTELAIRILQYLDARSLCHAAQVSRAWQKLADDDIIWHRMCEQHIDKKCKKCGWGLPLLDNKKRKAPSNMGDGAGGFIRTKRLRAEEEIPGAQSRIEERSIPAMSEASSTSQALMRMEGSSLSIPGSSKDTFGSRASSTPSPPTIPVPTTKDVPELVITSATESCQKIPVLTNPEPAPMRRLFKRAWKEIYAERLVVERNWRMAKYTLRELPGHTDSVMCLHYDESRSLLVTGSYDYSIRVWDTETMECVKVLTGHTRCVRGIHVDDSKIISGSMDRTLRIWNLKTFKCIRILEGHAAGVVCLHFNDKILASGSVDGSIRVWNLGAGCCYTLTGHRDWVNKVQIVDKKRLVSCSDDATVKIWDLETRQVLRTLSDHVGQIQGMQVILPHSPPRVDGILVTGGLLVTGALDNTVRIWCLETGECLKKLFGHVEGVWCIGVDSLRIVSGSQDRKVMVWELESGKSMYELTGHQGAVNVCQLSDTKIVTGGEDGVVRIWDFSPTNLFLGRSASGKDLQAMAASAVEQRNRSLTSGPSLDVPRPSSSMPAPALQQQQYTELSQPPQQQQQPPAPHTLAHVRILSNPPHQVLS